MLRWSQQWRSAARQSSIRRHGGLRYASNKPSTNATRASTQVPGSKSAGWFPRDGLLKWMLKRTLKWTLKWTIISWAAFVGWHTFSTYFFIYDPTYGISMLPTMSSFGDWVIISKRYRRGRGVVVGDIISFRNPIHEAEHAVKRVIGLSGDLVLLNTPGNSDGMIQVPEGHCWVVGDNLLHSRDSRHWGPLPLALISGKVISIIDWQAGFPKFAMCENGLQPAEEDDLD